MRRLSPVTLFPCWILWLLKGILLFHLLVSTMFAPLELCGIVRPHKIYPFWTPTIYDRSEFWLDSLFQRKWCHSTTKLKFLPILPTVPLVHSPILLQDWYHSHNPALDISQAQSTIWGLCIKVCGRELIASMCGSGRCLFFEKAPTLWPFISLPLPYDHCVLLTRGMVICVVKHGEWMRLFSAPTWSTSD